MFDPCQILRKISGSGIAHGRIFCHHFFHNTGNIFRNFRIHLINRDQSSFQMLPGNFHSGIAVIREVPCKKLIKCGSETVNIGTAIQGITGQLFGTDILRSPHDLITIRGAISILPHLCQSQVSQFGFASGSEHDIIRFDIPVNQSFLLPCIVQGFRHLQNDPHTFLPGNHIALFQNTFHGLPFHQFHGKIEKTLIIPHRICLHHIGMIQLGCSTGLFDKPDYKLCIICIIF